MKSIFLLMLPLALPLTKNDPPSHKKNTYYYYCESRAWDRNDFSSKQVVMFTDVKEVVCDEGDMRNKADEWGNKVNSLCENKSGCSSDFNYYPTLQAAREQRYQFIMSHIDTTKYTWRVVTPESTIKTYYYFCHSGFLKKDDPSPDSKKVIFYTDVKEITCDADLFGQMISKWGIVAKSLSEYKGPCPTNLDYYYTLQDARNRLEDWLRDHNDTTKYILKKLDLK